MVYSLKDHTSIPAPLHTYFLSQIYMCLGVHSRQSTAIVSFLLSIKVGVLSMYS
jgi:hypothetical protein